VVGGAAEELDEGMEGGRQMAGCGGQGSAGLSCTCFKCSLAILSAADARDTYSDAHRDTHSDTHRDTHSDRQPRRHMLPPADTHTHVYSHAHHSRRAVDDSEVHKVKVTENDWAVAGLPTAHDWHVARLYCSARLESRANPARHSGMSVSTASDYSRLSLEDLAAASSAHVAGRWQALPDALALSHGVVACGDGILETLNRGNGRRLATLNQLQTKVHLLRSRDHDRAQLQAKFDLLQSQSQDMQTQMLAIDAAASRALISGDDGVGGSSSDNSTRHFNTASLSAVDKVEALAWLFIDAKARGKAGGLASSSCGMMDEKQLSRRMRQKKRSLLQEHDVLSPHKLPS
jgi:hypothetical protein